MLKTYWHKTESYYSTRFSKIFSSHFSCVHLLFSCQQSLLPF
ncbi:hypothetical protein HMPREF9144_1712 [Prevotella pallens ATCC 700821]|uniref:Uncharacterized protein n=1 Tax=Prevotella pallens ATCC 700821 TaxID=997353 RepID=F9DJ72_9BACT|nr:hypothetical protein HMPREF9144_1712 [Prevotella pallens ATCC 700821]